MTSPVSIVDAAPSRTYRLFISTGEVSGDLQGALLVEALYRQAREANLHLEILALGGDRMAQAGATLLGNTSSIGAMGILESLPFVLPTLRLQQAAEQALRQSPPDVIVLIDYAGANLRMGKFVRKVLPKTPVIYYIAPQMWVWWFDPRQIDQVVRISDRLLAIFPEEARFFREKGANATWVGHPLLDRMQRAPSREEARASLGIDPDQRVIALLPASRHQELKYLMPVMFEAAQQIQAQLPDVQFWLPLSLATYRAKIEQAIARYGLQAKIIDTSPLPVIAAADLALTKSGTVNLEIALLNVPQVVLYRLSPLTAWTTRHLLKFNAPFISPANLVQMRRIVPEFLQDQAIPAAIVQESLDLLLNPTRRQQTLADYAAMRRDLGEVGASDRAAQIILAQIRSRPVDTNS